ncbi:MAG: cbb3-type cytochrome c oxidase subunit I [Anaerolineaceae bacterium]|jgi:cytochrome c oxidase subunit 1|nr:cbb3-type cytochrome c oxidase subunit I [Anaerolineaceae bacterium]OQY90785.1 MAG: hypothetical protein B6D38_03355 [Anaerolineae bacterium UTCFX1]
MSDHSIDGPAYGSENRPILRIALVYMLTGFVIFLIMGILGLIMRLDHAGWWVISPNWFYRIMTLHGAGMVASLLMAALGGIIAILNRTVKLSARWLWSAYVVYSLSVPFLLYAVLIGGFSGGWTALDPLPYHGMTWSKSAGVMMYVTFLAVGVGFLIYCVHIFDAVRRKAGGVRRALAWEVIFSRKSNPQPYEPEVAELAAIATAIIGIVTVIGGVLVLAPLFAEAAGLVDHVNPLYSKNFIMLFGHSIANVTIYIAVALVYGLLPVYTKRGGHTTKFVALAWNFTIILVLTPPPHHLYQDFAQPLGLAIIGQVASWSIAPSVLLLTILGNLSYIYRSGMRWAVPSVMIALGFWGWVFGGIGGTIDSAIPANQLLHNTLWVPAHFHAYYLLGVTTFVWGYLFYLISDLSGVREKASTKIAAWLYGIAGAGFLLVFFFSGADSIPRRYAVHLPEWNLYAAIAVPFVLLTIFSLLWIIADMIRGLRGAWRNTGATK